MFKSKKDKKKEKTRLSDALEFLVKKKGGADGEKTLKKLTDSNELVIGAYPAFMKNPNVINNELSALIENEALWRFANNQSRHSKRGPIAIGPPAFYHKGNKTILANHAPTLHQFVEYIEKAYEKTGKELTGLWWTFYRSDTDPGDVNFVKCGVMNPHRDRLGKATDRVIATLGCNTKGKQKRMSFEHQKKAKSKVWIDIHHGMYVCLSRQSSGNDKFNGKYVEHGIENAEGTWTITMEFSLKNTE